MSFTAHDAQIRVDNCGDCKDPCEDYKAGRIDHGDPCAACPRRIWHAWGNCGQAGRAAPMLPPSTTPPLLRTVRGWKRAGIRLVSRSERRQRGPICAGCDYVIRHPNGLVGCGAGCNCGAAAVSVMRQDAACKRKLWPA